MFMNALDVLSTLGFIGFGACVLGACVDYCDWFVITLIVVYLLFAIITKIFSIKQYKREVYTKARKRTTFEKIREYYNKGYYNKAIIEKLYKCGEITKTDMEIILAEV